MSNIDPSFIFQEFNMSLSFTFGNLICGIFSFLGSMAVIFTYLFNKNLRTISFKIIFYLGISEAFNSFAQSLSIFQYSNKYLYTYNYSFFCHFQAVLIYFTDTLTLIFVVIICFIIYQLIRNKNNKLEKYVNNLIFANIIFSFLLTLGIHLYFYIFKVEIEVRGKVRMSELRDYYGSWCWVKERSLKDVKTNKLVISIQIPIIITMIIYWILLIIIVYLILKVIKYYKIYQKNSNILGTLSHNHKMIKILINYPIVTSCWVIFSTINIIYPYYSRIYSTRSTNFYPGRISFIFLCLHSMLGSIKGFFVFIIFLNQLVVYSLYYRKLPKIFILFSVNNIKKEDINDSKK